MVRWVVTSAVLLSMMVPAAAAQSVPEVPRGSSFRVENGAECVANTDVEVSLMASDGSVRTLGSTIADGSGHFTFDAELGSAVPLGAAEVTALCGLGDVALVFDVLVVAPASAGLADRAPVALAAIAAVACVGLFIALRRRGARSTGGDNVDEIPEDPAPAPSLTALAEGEVDSEDDPDYWFWDTVTERGDVKRLACLSDHGFYLHEILEEDFNRLLEELAGNGPDVTLAKAFFAVPVASIDEVHRRGSQLRVVFHDGGQRLARVIDLGSEVEGVVDLLSRRVQVLAAQSIPAG